jgi:3-oxoacyl-[acyl-carrier protein] reductase
MRGLREPAWRYQWKQKTVTVPTATVIVDTFVRMSTLWLAGTGSPCGPAEYTYQKGKMSSSTTGRVALVTGGSGGIGRAICSRLAQDGTSIAVHYSGNAKRAQETVDSIVEAGGSAISVGADVGDQEKMGEVFDTVVERFGGVDVVVHTAGIMPNATIAEMNLATFDELVATNVRGTFIVAQLAAQCVRNGGAIINFSSSVTRLQQPTYGPYAATKAAAEALTLVLARELAGKDITVNTVAPGPTATPLFTAGKSDELIERVAGLNPMGRLGQPVDIAEVVAALAGPLRWVNGQTVFVNGGAA